MDQKTKKKAGTFALNRREPIHSWYSYVEGYSSCLVEDELNSLENKDIKTVYPIFVQSSNCIGPLKEKTSLYFSVPCSNDNSKLIVVGTTVNM